MDLVFDIDKLDNLKSLHAHEEELRAQTALDEHLPKDKPISRGLN